MIKRTDYLTRTYGKPDGWMSRERSVQAMGIIGAVMTPVGIAVSSLISEVIIGFIVALIASIFTQSATARS